MVVIKNRIYRVKRDRTPPVGHQTLNTVVHSLLDFSRPLTRSCLLFREWIFHRLARPLPLDIQVASFFLLYKQGHGEHLCVTCTAAFVYVLFSLSWNLLAIQ